MIAFLGDSPACLICKRKVRGHKFPSNLNLLKPRSFYYDYMFETEKGIRMVWALLCKEDYLWALKNQASAESIIGVRISNYEKELKKQQGNNE